MDLTPYLESVRHGVSNAAALADEHTQQVAHRLGTAIDSSTRLALIQVLSDAAGTLSAELAPTSVEVRIVGQDPDFVVSVPPNAPAPTLLVPPSDAEPSDEAADSAELDEEPLARISLRLPNSVKVRVDEMADADGVSTNAWLIRAVVDALAQRRRGPAPQSPMPPVPPSAGGVFGPHGPFGANGIFGAAGPFAARSERGSRPPRGRGRRLGRRAGLGPMTVRLAHPGVAQVSVENFDSGSITVQPGSDPDLVEGSLDAGDSSLLDDVVVRQDLDHLRITLPRRQFGSSSAQLRLGVPPGLVYNLTTGSASVTISADIARARITSGSGDISLGVARDVACTAGSGDISIAAVHGEAARVQTGSGDIRIDDARCPVSAKSGSGDVVIQVLHRAELQASSGSGDISVPSTTGSVDLKSASGSLAVGIADDLPAWLDLSSVSGRIRIGLEASAEPAPGEPYVSVRARTASGEIAVYRT